jgi:hypothetical protein
MKKWRVVLVEETHGEIYVEAQTENEAEVIAMHSPEIMWDDTSNEIHVCYVREVGDEEYQRNQ